MTNLVDAPGAGIARSRSRLRAGRRWAAASMVATATAEIAAQRLAAPGSFLQRHGAGVACVLVSAWAWYRLRGRVSSSPIVAGSDRLGPVFVATQRLDRTVPVRVLALGAFASLLAHPTDASLGVADIAVLAVLLAAGTVLAVRLGLPLWGVTEVALRPDGLRVPRSAWLSAGWYEIPWAAVSTGRWRWNPDRPTAVTVEIARPDLVRRRGFVLPCPPALAVGGGLVDAVRVSAAVRYYVDHPEHRPAIGSPAELDRLVEALG